MIGIKGAGDIGLFWDPDARLLTLGESMSGRSKN
jgi:hypothetical protein